MSIEPKLSNSLAGAFRALAQLASYYHEVTWPVTICTMFAMVIRRAGYDLRRIGHHVTGWDIPV